MVVPGGNGRRLCAALLRAVRYDTVREGQAYLVDMKLPLFVGIAFCREISSLWLVFEKS